MKSKTLKLLIVTVAAIAILSVGAVTLTSAYLYAQAEVVNTADKGEVTNRIDEDFNGIEKTNVKIENTGNVSSFVRVAIVPVWRDESGNPTTLSAEGTYTIKINTEDWIEDSNGFYYCKTDIEPSEFTPVLIESCTVNDNLSEDYNGMTFDLQVIAQSIQSDPQDIVTDVWNVNVDDTGNLELKI